MSSLNDFLNHPIETLERALHIRKQIDRLNEALTELFGPAPISLAGVQTEVPKRKGKRTMSAAGRARVAAAQPARWAKVKGSEPAVTAKAPMLKPKGRFSAAHRAKLAASAKARWARLKARKSTTVSAKIAPAPKKKGTISPEGLARIKAAQKLRWAKFRKGKGSAAQKIANAGQPKFKIF